MLRRRLLTFGAAACVAPVVARAQAARSITFASYGGSYGDFMKEYWLKPFTAETGVSVQFANGVDMAKLKAQVQSGNIEWDVFDMPGTKAYAGAKDGLWETIDTKIVDPARFPNKMLPFAVPTAVYLGGIGYDPARIQNPAKDFAQLWDAKSFPGRRGIHSQLSGTLEMALLADGVPAKSIYPLDVERAFKALERIKPQVKKWYAETTQGISLIQSNEVDYTYTYANRVRTAKESGVSIDFSLNQCIITPGYFGVTKGTKQKEAAMRFLEFVTRPAQQASLANKLGAAPVVNGVESLVDPAVRKWLPDYSNPKHLYVNDAYWADKFVELDKRLKEWMLT